MLLYNLFSILQPKNNIFRIFIQKAAPRPAYQPTISVRRRGRLRHIDPLNSGLTTCNKSGVILSKPLAAHRRIPPNSTVILSVSEGSPSILRKTQRWRFFACAQNDTLLGIAVVGEALEPPAGKCSHFPDLRSKYCHRIVCTIVICKANTATESFTRL